MPFTIWICRKCQSTGSATLKLDAADAACPVPIPSFEDHVIVLCVRWYLRYCLTLRDLEELMAERGLSIDHSPIGRWVLRYSPELYKRIRREIHPPNRSWRVDEMYVRV